MPFSPPAYPCEKQDSIRVVDKRWDGLTKREYAAIHICAAMRANGDRWRGTDETFEDYARSSVAQADALLAELAK